MAEIETLREIRLRHVRYVLEHTHGDIEQASLILDIKPQDLRQIMQELGTAEASEEKTRQSNPIEE